MASQGTMEHGVAARLASLRDSANADSAGAADAAWAWINEMGDLSKSDHDGADAQLNEMFRLGATPPIDLNGPTEGIAVMFTIQDHMDAVLRPVIEATKVWDGKKFDAESHTGINSMSKGMSIAGKLFWPMYTMKTDETGHKWAFDFKTFIEPSVDDANVNVFVIDYKDVESNPSLIVKKVRDEMTELVPTVYLGKIMYRLDSGDHTKLGYFALRTK